MKRKAYIGVVFVLFLGTQLIHSQRKTNNTNAHSAQVPKTLVGQFEFDMDVNKTKKENLRQKFTAHIKQLKNTIDTLDISNRRRARLLATLEKNPFDERLLALTEEKQNKKGERNLK